MSSWAVGTLPLSLCTVELPLGDSPLDHSSLSLPPFLPPSSLTHLYICLSLMQLYACLSLMHLCTCLARWLWLATQPGQQATIRFSVFTPSGNAYDDVASYSSFGPTPDGRFKPDIVAPGATTSASADGRLSAGNSGCGTTRRQVWGCGHRGAA